MAVGRIHSTESFGAVDGPGIRFVVFLQGCALRCRYCHNPDSWDPAGGRLVEAGALVGEIAGYRNFIRTGGVTLSGGEPLLQPDFAREVLDGCRAAGFHTALDTAGSVPPDESASVIAAADLLLLDLKASDDALARKLTGRGNREMLATLDFCEKAGKPVWIRQVLVPGFTLEPECLRRSAALLRPYRCIERVELLPYHRLGLFKWERLGLTCPLADTPEPAPAEVAAAEALFRDCGLPL